MIYLVTNTAATAAWMYRGVIEDPPRTPTGQKIPVPLGFASFPGEVPPLNPPRSLLERTSNLVHYTKMPRGGHFACLEEPELFVQDVRAFFQKVRRRATRRSHTDRRCCAGVHGADRGSDLSVPAASLTHTTATRAVFRPAFPSTRRGLASSVTRSCADRLAV
jgi:hypothetical protein